jgi:Ca2+-binding RTX toxin-like protein
MADITGTERADTLAGTTLQDLIMAKAGDDTIDAGDGNDVAYGGAGLDRLAGGLGDDVLYGGSGDDVIEDGAGNDYVNGGSDNDRVIAGEGDDAYHGGSGFDTIDFSAATGAMTIDISKSAATGLGVDVIRGFEGLVSGAFDDTIKGSKNVDDINGGSGNDVIRGLGGADVLAGGEGDDLFQFKWSDVVDALTGEHKGVDVISDFVSGDQIDVRALLEGQLFDGYRDVVRAVDNEGGTTLQVYNLDEDAFVDVVQIQNVAGSVLFDGGILFN